jgi:H+/Cl- antiporter ClcA
MTFLSNRHKRIFKIFSARWQRRAIFLLGGIAVGAAAVALAQLADLAQIAFSALVTKFRYASLAVTPLGFALSVFLTNRFFHNAQGSGIPQAIAARHLTDQTAREGLVSLRIGAGKIILTLLGLLCGASVGREGPTVQIGASIMFALGRFSPRRQPGLILAGAAAGVAAAFNTPLAGIVFGIEEMSRAFETRTSSLIIAAVIAAGLTSLALLGNYTYFGTSPAALRNGIDCLAIPLCGVVGGLAGGLFSRILIAMARGFANPVGRAIKRYPLGFAVVCGLAAAVCGIVSGDTVYGTGYSQVKAALESGLQLPASFGVLKFLATTFASISGMPGGIFSPSLAVGAALGANIAMLFHDAPLPAIMLLGMVSYFAGVVQAPITAFVIVTEMTDNHAMVVPLMEAALIAHASSR